MSTETAAAPKIRFGTDWTYAPAPETAKVRIDPKYDLFINGKFVPPIKGRYFDTVNPANLKKLSEVADATAEDVDVAVKAARRAYDKFWSKLPPRERGKYLYRIARILQERARE